MVRSLPIDKVTKYYKECHGAGKQVVLDFVTFFEEQKMVCELLIKFFYLKVNSRHSFRILTLGDGCVCLCRKTGETSNKKESLSGGCMYMYLKINLCLLIFFLHSK